MTPSARAAIGRPAGQRRRGPEPPAPPGGARRATRWTLGALAALLVLSSPFLPIWHSNLSAPQYPDGLSFVAYGTRVAGDLDEINNLNHYVGMRPFDTADFPEMALWPVAVGTGVAAVAVAALFANRRLLARLARLYLWLLPTGILGVIQFRLYQLGHDLDPGAAFRMDGFTPLVFGPTTVWNFTAWSHPGGAIVVLYAAAALLSFGPGLTRRLRNLVDRRRGAAAAVVLVAAVVAAPGVDADAATGGDDLAALLAAVPDGATLHLPAGTYRGDIVVDRPVTIDGGGEAQVVGSGTGTVITITAPGTVLRGLRVTGSGLGPIGGPAGIRIEADDVRIEGVAVEHTYIGIAVDGASQVYLVDNVVRGRGDAGIGGEGHAVGADDRPATSSGQRGDGISLWNADGVLVRGNVIEDTRDGVYVSFGSGAFIDGNEIRTSRYAVHSMFAADMVLVENLMEHNLSAAVLMYGGPALVLRNTLVDNRSPSTGFGLLLKDVAGAEVVQNVLARNRAGIHIDSPGAEPSRLTANTIARNHVGVVLYPATSAVFHANSFVDNTVQVLQQGRGTADVAWHDRGHGNFWSTYRGYDNGRGRGVTAHVEGSAVERLLVRAPILTPLATSPALRLVRAVEERWTGQRPVLVDPLPLTDPISPPVPASPPSPAAGAVLGLLGGSTALLAAATLHTLGRRRPVEATP